MGNSFQYPLPWQHCPIDANTNDTGGDADSDEIQTRRSKSSVKTLFSLPNDSQRVFELIAHIVLLVPEGPQHYEFHRGIGRDEPRHDGLPAGRLGHRLVGDDQGDQVLRQGELILLATVAPQQSTASRKGMELLLLAPVHWKTQCDISSRSEPQVMYFSSVFPYVVLFIFLIRGLLLDGAMDGVTYMFYPKVGTFTGLIVCRICFQFKSRVSVSQVEIWGNVQVWRQAATQVFFALGLGYGSVIAYSSYNPVHNNCHRDAIMVSGINFMTSVLATLVVFVILGFRAKTIALRCVAK